MRKINGRIERRGGDKWVRVKMEELKIVDF